MIFNHILGLQRILAYWRCVSKFATETELVMLTFMTERNRS